MRIKLRQYIQQGEKVKGLVAQQCRTLQPYGLAYQSPLSTEFSRQEYWTGWPCPLPGDLLNSVSANLEVQVVIKMFSTKICFTNMDSFPGSYGKPKQKNVHRKMEIYKFLPLKVPPIVSFNRCFLVQSLSHVQLFATPWTAAHQPSLSFTISQSLFKLMPIESVMQSNHLILCHPLLLLTSIFPSIRVFSNESALCIKQPKYWSFSFNISSSNEYSGLISFRTD